MPRSLPTAGTDAGVQLSLVQKDYYSTQEALERVRLALPQEDAEQNLIEVLPLGKCTAWFVDQAAERFDIPTELWDALLKHRSINRKYDTFEVDWETGKVLCLWMCERDSLVGSGRRGLLRFDREQIDSAVKPSHSVSPWDLLEEIRFEEAVCLWCDIEPYKSPRARRDQHPESVPVERFLLAAYKSGELPVRTETLKWIFSVKQTGLPADNGAFVQKADLRMLVEQKDISPRPRFFFPGDNEASSPDPVHEMQSKGGQRRSGAKIAAMAAVRLIEEDIEGQLTRNTAISYFREARTVHPGFQDAYYDKQNDRIAWKDKDGAWRKISFSTVGRYRRELKKETPANE